MMENVEWKMLVLSAANISLIFFIVYFAIFLIVDLLAFSGGIQYNILSPSIYTSALAYLIISGSLLLISFYFLYKDRGYKTFLAGLVFIASPIRSLLMINLGAWYISLIYDLIVISITSILLYKIGSKENILQRRAAFISLFLLFIFLISLAVVVRDLMVFSGNLPTISFGSYLHYGIYDYLTAFYSIVLGAIAIKYSAKEFSSYRKMQEKIKQIENLINNKRYLDAIKLCEEVMIEGEGRVADKLKIIYAYSLHRVGENEKALKILKDVKGEFGLKGDVYLELGEYDKAEENYKMAIQQNPKDSASWVNLGKIYVDRGDMSNAERCFRMGMEANKKNVAAWQNLSALALVKGRYEDALKILAEAEKYVGKE